MIPLHVSPMAARLCRWQLLMAYTAHRPAQAEGHCSTFLQPPEPETLNRNKLWAHLMRLCRCFRRVQ